MLPKGTFIALDESGFSCKEVEELSLSLYMYIIIHSIIYTVLYYIVFYFILLYSILFYSMLCRSMLLYYTSLHTYMYVCVYVCMYVCMCVYTYVYIYIYTHIHICYIRVTGICCRFWSIRCACTPSNHALLTILYLTMSHDGVFCQIK